jgi:hypothetical protein
MLRGRRWSEFFSVVWSGGFLSMFASFFSFFFLSRTPPARSLWGLRILWAVYTKQRPWEAGGIFLGEERFLTKHGVSDRVQSLV